MCSELTIKTPDYSTLCVQSYLEKHQIKEPDVLRVNYKNKIKVLYVLRGNYENTRIKYCM